MNNATKRRTELADFLRTRRARLQPEQFGLATFGRRRTPGLRREEVAQLAGVGVSWYTWLEQGREITVSDLVLERLAQIFHLERQERQYLFVLARGMVPVAHEGADVVSPPAGLQAVLDALGTTPAFLVDHHLTVIAWNESACRIFGDFSLLTERERNNVWRIFAHPSSRQLYVDWEQAAQHAVVNFRSAYGQFSGDAWFEDFLRDLQRESPEFRRLWSQHDVEIACNFIQQKELYHQQVGRLALSSTVFVVPVDPWLHMVTYTPCTQETAIKLETLKNAGYANAITR